jgi:aspartate dehydrogenase
MSQLRIGIVGCGAIGSSLAKAIKKGFAAKAQLSALYDIEPAKSAGLAKRIGSKNLAVNALQDLIRKSELVVECASAASSRQIARAALSAGRDIMIMSVGGVVGHCEELSRLAKAAKARVYIPSGAIAGIDALKAAGIGKVRRVTLTTRKNPVSFRGVKYVETKGIDLTGLKGDKTLFCGPAKEAVKYFPQNINVAAVLSLAGIGAQKTEVRIIASPQAKRNTHEISIESAAGDIFTRVENVLHPDNPKTSFLAVLSAIATLRQILEPVRIGT